MSGPLATRLFFDARYIRVGHHDGISRFSSGLIWALADRIDLTVLISDLRQLEKLPPNIDFKLLSDPTSWREIFIPRQLNRLGAKLVYSPMQTMGSFGRKYQLVLTLHDLIYYRHRTPPRGLNFWIRLFWRLFHLAYWPQRIILNGADAVVTVSETTRSLIKQKRLTRRPVSVVYNSAGQTNNPRVVKPETALAKRADEMPRRLLYMGSFMGYKNVEVLASATKSLENYELHLLSPISPTRQSQLQSLGDPKKMVFHNGVSELEYEQLLRESFALVSASLDEGFGIPLVEAMNHGLPIVVSDIEIFREIGGECALYFDPHSSNEFISRLRELERGANWVARSQSALVQAKRFSWSKSADALTKALNQISG